MSLKLILAFVLLGLSQGAFPFIAPISLAVLLHTRFIRHEEQALEATFGDDYRAYKARVRRWL